ncbi:hypothetical protein [uncultured Jatrophihabitans sp.]|uniref:hypothetical protein n=1 Tax=uncultured Jatrophihabitans sp. TaxID=1610747 RepID=UPI0035CB0E35
MVLALPAGRLVDRQLPFWLGFGALLTATGAVVRLIGDGYGIALAGQVLALATGAAFGADHLPALLVVQALLTVAAAGWLVLELRRPVAEPDVAATTVRLRAVWADRQVRVLVGVLLLVMVMAGVAASATVPPLVARRGAESHFLLLPVVAEALAFVLLASAPGVGTGLVAVVGLGVFLLADLPVILDLAERCAGEAGGTVSALIWLAGNAAGLVAALVVQALDGHPTAAFLVLAALVAGGVPLVRMLAPPQRVTAELS